MSMKPQSPPPFLQNQPDSRPSATGFPDELGPSSRALLMQRIQEATLREKAATARLAEQDVVVRSLEFQLVAAELESQRAKESYQRLFEHYQQSQVELQACAAALERSKDAIGTSAGLRQAMENELRERTQEVRRLQEQNRELRACAEEKSRTKQDL